MCFLLSVICHNCHIVTGRERGFREEKIQSCREENYVFFESDDEVSGNKGTRFYIRPRQLVNLSTNSKPH